MSDPFLDTKAVYARRHKLFGWRLLAVYLALGIVLETLHGLKLGFYLEPQHRMRRMLWTLAHAHGTLLSLLQIVFAVWLEHKPQWTAGRMRWASACLLIGLVLVPLGFFAGGFGHTEVDPSIGVLLVPPGAMILLIGVSIVAWEP